MRSLRNTLRPIALCMATWAVTGGLLFGAATTRTALMRSEELRRGMVGRGLTVLRGTRVEEFRVEIVGVMRNAWPRGDLILARLRGAGLERTGVAAGMSGSPVYVDGKLVGAVAYTWQFVTEPLCGITPIHQMLGAIQPRAKTNVQLARTWNWQEALPAVARLPLKGDDPWLPARTVGEGPRRIRTPLLVSSYSPRLMSELSPLLKRFGLDPIQAGNGGGTGRVVDIQPGSAMGVQLIGGDVSVSALGTATYRDGDRVVGFGHPMFSAGACELPMTGGYVHLVIPSQQFSFKMGEATEVVGRLTGDFAFGVAGEVGKVAPTVPCTVTINNRTRDRTEKYRFTLARDRNWTWFLAGWAVAAAIEKTEASGSGHTLAVRLKAKVAGRQTVTLEDRIFSLTAAKEAMAMGWLVRLLWENPWESVDVGELTAEIDLIEERRTAEIVGLRLSAGAAHRGEKLTAFVRLRPYKSSQIVEQSIPFRIPLLAPAGAEVGVIACDARTNATISRMLAPGRYRPVSLDQLVQILEEFPSGDRLALRVAKTGQGVTLEGDAMPGLPNSIRQVITGAAQTGFELMRDDTMTTVKTPWVLEGGAFLRVRVKADEEP